MNQEPGSFDQRREPLGEYRHSPLEDKIVQITRNDRASVQALGEIIAGEPLLAARLLRLAHGIPGLPQTLSTLAQLVSILGADELKALALGISLFSPEPNPEPDDRSAILRQLWEHSVGSALFAGRGAEKIGNVSPQAAFAAGFLHDVGRLLLYRYSREHYLTSTAVAREKHIPLTEAETLACGFNHLELGEVWSEKTVLHRSLTEVIRYHHEPLCMLPDFVAADVRKIVAVVQLSHLACENQGIGASEERMDGGRELWSACNLKAEEMADEVLAIKREIEANREIFGFSADDSRSVWPRRRSAAPASALASEAEKKPTPARRGQVIPFPPRSDYSPKGGEHRSAKRLTILVVEDHGSLCEMLSLYLIRYGYHVRTADNGQAALDLLTREEVDLVLLDLMLPRLDGFSVLKRIRETSEYSRPYIIIVSAGASEKDRNRVLELGANEYMPKPFHLTRLLERIRAVEKYLLS